MYRLLVVLLTLSLASLAFGADSGLKAPQVPFKSDSHVGQNAGEPSERQGGDTTADATVIPGLPYLDAGTTTGYNDDYDEVCPYSGSTSPDVVYMYTAGANMAVNLDLCSDGNQYDTKMYVYENAVTPGFPHACNDDFCSNSYTSYASRLENVAMTAGNTYYIVIDGYGGDMGPYELYIEQAPDPVFVECAEDYWVPEGEPPPTDFQPDTYNGGCNSAVPVFQLINWVDEETGCAHLCGQGGTYLMPLGNYRDTDWFEVYADGFEISGSVLSEYFTQILVSGANPDCFTVVWDIVATFNANSLYNFSIPTNPGDLHWIWIGAGDWNVDIFNYELEVCGIFFEFVPTEPASWGSVKAQYK